MKVRSSAIVLAVAGAMLLALMSRALAQGPTLTLPSPHWGEGRVRGDAAGAWNVELVSQIGGPTYAVAVQGEYAYLGQGPRLIVSNVADPSHPAFVDRRVTICYTWTDSLVSSELLHSPQFGCCPPGLAFRQQ